MKFDDSSDNSVGTFESNFAGSLCAIALRHWTERGAAPSFLTKSNALDSVPIQVVFRHPTLHPRPHVNPGPASFLTSPPNPKRCPAEFSPLPRAIVYRTIVLMQEALNNPIALSQSRTQNDRVLVHNFTKCYTTLHRHARASRLDNETGLSRLASSQRNGVSFHSVCPKIEVRG